MNQEKLLLHSKTVLRIGLIAGIVVLYTGLIGMIQAFDGREVVYQYITLGRVLLYVPPFVAAFLAGRRIRKQEVDMVKALPLIVLGGVGVGLLTAVPTLIMLFLNTQLNDVRSILVNVNNAWVDIVTFDNRDALTTGGLVLLRYMGILGGAGALLAILPHRLRRAIVIGLTFTVTVGVFGETVRLILQEILPRDLLDQIFRRSSLRQPAALRLLILSLIGGFIWSYLSKPVSQQYSALPAQPKQATRYLGLALFAALLLALPWLIGRSLSDATVTIGLFILMGFGLNIAIGLAGLLDLGYVTNYAVGAYVMAVLTTTGPLAQGPEFLNFWLVIPAALLAAMLTGFLFALPVLKMRGDYLAIATLGFGEIIGKLAISDWLRPVIGGAQGVLFIPKPTFFGVELRNPEQLYYIVLGACILTLFVSVRLNNSRTGRQWMAIREDEDVAAAMGINVARAKLLAFTLSATTGGIAGAIFAAKVGTVFPNSFTVFISINVLSLIIVGGMGSNPGIVIGAIVLVGMPELLREFSDYRWLMYGALLIFMMINRPEGLIPSKVHQREILDLDPDKDPDLPPLPTSTTEPASA